MLALGFRVSIWGDLLAPVDLGSGNTVRELYKLKSRRSSMLLKVVDFFDHQDNYIHTWTICST